MKVLITGASGFVGREIISEFVLNNHQVIGLGKSNKNNQVINQQAKYFYADITNYEELSKLEELQKVDLVIHSAGLAHQFGETSREQFQAVNVKGTENILKLAAKLRTDHFILIGSTAVYGIIKCTSNKGTELPVIDEETPLNPQTLYAESKLESEKICRHFCEANDIVLTIFRLAPVIGEGNVGNVARLIDAIDKNRFVWIGDGSNLKTLIYKRDVARACLQLAEKKHNGMEIFNLAGEPVKMKTFVEEIATQLNKKILPIRIPTILFRKIFQLNSKTVKSKKVNKLAETIEKWLSDDVYSANRIKNDYEFKVKTSVLEAVARQIDYYKSERN